MTPTNVQDANTATSPQVNEDNVVTRAEQGHLTLLDWQIANPLAEAARMPKARRRAAVDWYTASILALMASAAVAGASLLLHLG